MIRRRATRHRSVGRGADKGSLAVAMLLVLVGISLTAMMTPILLRQITSSRTTMNWAHALSGAQAGFQVALAQIRASNGDITDLPCGPLSGHVNSPDATRYQVTIDYLTADPSGHVATSYLTSASSNDAWITSHKIACGSSGTAQTPAYALLRSLGTSVPTGTITTVANRAMWAQYKFATTNANIPGGMIRTWPGGTELCFDAGSAQPNPGTQVRMQPCVGGAPQTWAYRSNLTLMLVSTEEWTPMCLDAGSPHVVGAVVTLQDCGGTTQPQQQWSYNQIANFEGTSDGVTRDGFCFNVESPTVSGSRVVLGSTGTSRCNSTNYTTRESFEPEPTVGAGAAPASASGRTQVVNYHYFGTCIDIPAADTRYTYVMTWTCKQEPGGDVEWNQMWTMPTPSGTAITANGQLSTTCNNIPEVAYKCTNGVAYCLRSPLSTAAGAFVAAVPCSTGGTSLMWTRYGQNADTYEQRFQIVDTNGNCLTSLGDTEGTVHGDIYKIAVRTCDGSGLQKWNADPNLDNGLPLQNIGER